MLIAALLSFLLIAPPAGQPIERIAFGSCWRDQGTDGRDNDGALAAAAEWGPEVFVFLGDNVYADTTSPAEFDAAYDRLAASPAFRQLRAEAAVLAIWDDHDYGVNDGGAEYPQKELAKRKMLDFFGEPEDSARRARPGNYDAMTFGQGDRTVQFLLLDTRSFRSPLKTKPLAVRRTYVGNTDADATVLGDAQWQWLHEQLAQPAAVRVVCTSIQLLPSGHRFEKWANFPNDRQKMIDALAAASGTVVVLSGDRHHGEITAGEHFVEVTSSALNQNRRRAIDEPNPGRIGDPMGRANFGTMTIDWNAGEATLSLRDQQGEQTVRTTVEINK
jgi:alkaline phosphatase D